MLAQRPFYPDVPDELRELCRGEGLSLLGIADVAREDVADLRERYLQWIAAGYHGDMGFLADHAGLKYRPDQLLPGCRSVLAVACNYYQHAPWRPARRTFSAAAEGEAGRPPIGRVARYAWGRDYHRGFGKRLRRIAKALAARYPEHSFRSFTDATPLGERAFGEAAGIGFTGRNTLLINGQYGSWFFVGEILSTYPFAPGESAGQRHGACPRSCRKCLDVCPTGALIASHTIDARRCISYLTIELKGSIPEDLRPLMGDWIFGCDLCQEVCPLNVRATVTDIGDFTNLRAGPSLDLGALLAIESREEFVGRFAGTPLMRPGREGMIRNACVAAANVGAVSLKPVLAKRAHDSSAVIREHARWALSLLGEKD